MGIGLAFVWAEYKAHLVMTMTQLCIAIFMIILQSVLSKDISGLVLVVYEHTVATFVLSAMAFFLERGKRPPLSLQILGYSIILGLLQITLSQLLLTLSLQYIEANDQSIGLNLMAIVVYVLAVVFKQEKLHFGSIQGQAKLWGILVSSCGALTIVLWQGPTLLKSTFNGPLRGKNFLLGGTMLVGAVLAGAAWDLILGPVSRKYPAILSLSAMASFFGTIITAVFTVFLVKRTSWDLKWEGGLILVAILWGGVLVTGLLSFAQSWCVYKKGPVFTAAFNPLLIVFSFLLEAAVLRKSIHLGSMIGAVLVIVGLYLLLWGKSNEERDEMMERDEKIISPLIG